MKSQKSSQVVPAANGSNLNTLNPSAVVKASRKIMIPHTRHPFGLDQPVRSRIIARMFSHTPSTVDIAAKIINMKNRLPHIRPPDILLNTVAMVSKRRLGPALTSRPYVKQAGKMIIPARIATKVSRRITFTDSPIRECSLPM